MTKQQTINLELSNKFQTLLSNLQNQILGQPHLCKQLLVALLSDGHLLVEGAPGLAKTRAVKCLSDLIEGQFHRVQFTPDLLPSDLTGTDVYDPRSAQFSFQAGPLFHNIVLADEINRAPAKVQSALLEAMAEQQITIGKTSHPLPELFMVMATQNPIEQEGTYPLPEAQLDRFMMQINISYPDSDIEGRIVDLALKQARTDLDSSRLKNQTSQLVQVTQSEIADARADVLDLFIAEPVKQYIIQLIIASRSPGAYDEDLASWIAYGASPRGSISLERASRAHAWLQGREYVSPDDVQNMVFDILRHRIILSFSAQARGITTEDVIERLITLVPVP